MQGQNLPYAQNPAPGNRPPNGVPAPMQPIRPPTSTMPGGQSGMGPANAAYMRQPGSMQPPIPQSSAPPSYYSAPQQHPPPQFRQQASVRPPVPSSMQAGQMRQPQNTQHHSAPNYPPSNSQSSASLHSQMGNMSLQNIPNANGHMHPPPQAAPRPEMQPPPAGPPAPGIRTPYVQPGPPRPGMPPPGTQAQYSPQSQPAPSAVAPPPSGPASSQQFARPYPASQQKMAVRPNAMRPTPANMAARPLPGGYPPQNGVPDPSQSAQQLPPSEFSQAPPQNPPQLTTSMMPRPAHTACGKPRIYYHRGMTVSEHDRTVMTVPNSNSDFISVDDGSARIRFVRLTTSAIASEPNVMTKTGVPLAIVMTPFANTLPGEAPIPIVDFSDKQVGGPLRCERCNGYANPGFKFSNGGSEFHCNLCTHLNKTPAEHFSPISHTGERMDADIRPELRVGSVEYIVGSPDYCIRPPRPACYLYAVDVSAGAVSSGLASAAMMSIKSAVGAGLLPGSSDGARIAFMTFDRALHFFDARGAEEGRSVSVQVVPDIEDPFVPLGGDGLFLTPEQAVYAVDSAMELHGLNPSAANNPERTPPPVECVLGSALEAIKLAFADCGGKAFVVVGSLPNAGIKKLERRGGGAMGGSEEREMALLKEANSSYDILGCEFAEIQTSVDLFMAPASLYMDASTLSRLPRACGGRMYLYSEFDPIVDGASLHRSLCSAASGIRAFEALMRVRTSPGLEAKGEYVGYFARPQRGDDVSGPVFDASSTLALEVTVTSKLTDDGNDGINQSYSLSSSLYNDACFQSAILFTDCAGRRRIRVHTVFAKKTSVLSEVFSHADVDATAAYLAKKVASAVLVGGTTFTKASDAVTEKTAQMFFVYRKHCTSSPVGGQLILPESYKVLPVMMLGLIKSAALRRADGPTHSGDAVTIDERAATLSFLISGTVADVAAMCYPRMWEVQNLDEAAGVPLPPAGDPAISGDVSNGHKPMDSAEPISIPNTLPLSSESLRDDRILLIENGMRMVVWIGGQVEPSASRNIVAESVGGRIVIRGETANAPALLKEVDSNGKRLGFIIQRIVSERSRLSHPQVIERSNPIAGGEARWVLPMLVEDRGSSVVQSYVEYLKTIHRRVMNKMANDSAQSDLQTWEMLNHGY